MQAGHREQRFLWQNSRFFTLLRLCPNDRLGEDGNGHRSWGYGRCWRDMAGAAQTSGSIAPDDKRASLLHCYDADSCSSTTEIS
jgi:hypothetical protein